MLTVISDENRTADETVSVVEECCRAAADRAGALRVQLRHRGLCARDLLALADRLRRTTADHGVALIVNDRIDVALACEADGVHLPASGLAPRDARRIVGDAKLIGRSVHSAAEIRELSDEPLDYLHFGPVFFTSSKAAYGSPQGCIALSEAVHCAGNRPVIAVGGIDATRIGELHSAGISAQSHPLTGVAAIGAIFSAADPAAATAELLSAIERLQLQRQS